MGRGINRAAEGESATLAEVAAAGALVAGYQAAIATRNRLIRRAARRGHSQSALARAAGLSTSQAHRIIRGAGG